MPPYEKQLLEKIAKQSEDNNKILHRLQSSLRWSRAISILKWTLIIGLAVGAYYYIQPYLEAVFAAYNSFQDATGGVKLDLPGTEGFQSLLTKFFGL